MSLLEKLKKSFDEKGGRSAPQRHSPSRVLPRRPATARSTGSSNNSLRTEVLRASAHRAASDSYHTMERIARQYLASDPTDEMKRPRLRSQSVGNPEHSSGFKSAMAFIQESDPDKQDLNPSVGTKPVSAKEGLSPQHRHAWRASFRGRRHSERRWTSDGMASLVLQHRHRSSAGSHSPSVAASLASRGPRPSYLSEGNAWLRRRASLASEIPSNRDRSQSDGNAQRRTSMSSHVQLKQVSKGRKPGDAVTVLPRRGAALLAQKRPRIRSLDDEKPSPASSDGNRPSPLSARSPASSHPSLPWLSSLRDRPRSESMPQNRTPPPLIVESHSDASPLIPQDGRPLKPRPALSSLSQVNTNMYQNYSPMVALEKKFVRELHTRRASLGPKDLPSSALREPSPASGASSGGLQPPRPKRAHRRHKSMDAHERIAVRTPTSNHSSSHSLTGQRVGGGSADGSSGKLRGSLSIERMLKRPSSAQRFPRHIVSSASPVSRGTPEEQRNRSVSPPGAAATKRLTRGGAASSSVSSLLQHLWDRKRLSHDVPASEIKSQSQSTLDIHRASTSPPTSPKSGQFASHFVSPFLANLALKSTGILSSFSLSRLKNEKPPVTSGSPVAGTGISQSASSSSIGLRARSPANANERRDHSPFHGSGHESAAEGTVTHELSGSEIHTSPIPDGLDSEEDTSPKPMPLVEKFEAVKEAADLEFSDLMEEVRAYIDAFSPLEEPELEQGTSSRSVPHLMAQESKPTIAPSKSVPVLPKGDATTPMQDDMDSAKMTKPTEYDGAVSGQSPNIATSPPSTSPPLPTLDFPSNSYDYDGDALPPPAVGTDGGPLDGPMSPSLPVRDNTSYESGDPAGTEPFIHEDTDIVDIPPLSIEQVQYLAEVVEFAEDIVETSIDMLMNSGLPNAEEMQLLPQNEKAHQGPEFHSSVCVDYAVVLLMIAGRITRLMQLLRMEWDESSAPDGWVDSDFAPNATWPVARRASADEGRRGSEGDLMESGIGQSVLPASRVPYFRSPVVEGSTLSGFSLDSSSKALDSPQAESFSIARDEPLLLEEIQAYDHRYRSIYSSDNAQSSEELFLSRKEPADTIQKKGKRVVASLSAETRVHKAKSTLPVPASAPAKRAAPVFDGTPPPAPFTSTTDSAPSSAQIQASPLLTAAASTATVPNAARSTAGKVTFASSHEPQSGKMSLLERRRLSWGQKRWTEAHHSEEQTPELLAPATQHRRTVSMPGFGVVAAPPVLSQSDMSVGIPIQRRRSHSEGTPPVKSTTPSSSLGQSQLTKEPTIDTPVDSHAAALSDSMVSTSQLGGHGPPPSVARTPHQAEPHTIPVPLTAPARPLRGKFHQIRSDEFTSDVSELGASGQRHEMELEFGISPPLEDATERQRRREHDHRTVKPTSHSSAVPPSSDYKSPPTPFTAHTPKQRINLKDFHIVKPISRGGFGSVLLAELRDESRKAILDRMAMGGHADAVVPETAPSGTTTKSLFAIKMLCKDEMVRKNVVSQVIAERNIMHQMGDLPFVVKFYCSFQTKNNLFLVMEYCPGGDLFSLLRALGVFDEATACRYIAEVVLALESLHSMGIVHRDVKPDNLLVAADGHIKLTDFGLSLYGLVTRNQAQQFNAEETTPRPHFAKTHRTPGRARTIIGRSHAKDAVRPQIDALITTPLRPRNVSEGATDRAFPPLPTAQEGSDNRKRRVTPREQQRLRTELLQSSTIAATAMSKHGVGSTATATATATATSSSGAHDSPSLPSVRNRGVRFHTDDDETVPGPLSADPDTGVKRRRFKSESPRRALRPSVSSPTLPDLNVNTTMPQPMPRSFDDLNLPDQHKEPRRSMEIQSSGVTVDGEEEEEEEESEDAREARQRALFRTFSTGAGISAETRSSESVGANLPGTAGDADSSRSAHSTSSKGHHSVDGGSSQTTQPSPTKAGGSGKKKRKSKKKFIGGTPDYLAPEIIMGFDHDFSVDWWSLGAILFEFLTGAPPFAGPTVKQIFQNILVGAINWPTGERAKLINMSSEATDFLTQLLKNDTKQRLGHENGAADVKAHPFFRNIDWTNIRSKTPTFVPEVESPHDTGYFEERETLHPTTRRSFLDKIDEEISSHQLGAEEQDYR